LLWQYLLYLAAICYILCSFGTFFPFWYTVSRKIWQPWPTCKTWILIRYFTSAFIDGRRTDFK
jgi:hypothetical protein